VCVWVDGALLLLACLLASARTHHRMVCRISQKYLHILLPASLSSALPGRSLFLSTSLPWGGPLFYTFRCLSVFCSYHTPLISCIIWNGTEWNDKDGGLWGLQFFWIALKARSVLLHLSCLLFFFSLSMYLPIYLPAYLPLQRVHLNRATLH
jgi:hypothetical protein